MFFEVQLKVLKNTRTDELVKIITKPGGRVEQLHLRNSENLRDVLVGHESAGPTELDWAKAVHANTHWKGVPNPLPFQSRRDSLQYAPCVGAMLAPFANRIANGSYVFDGVKHYLPRNECTDVRCGALHGFLDTKSMSIDASGTDEKGAFLILSHRFGDDPGYPFQVNMTIKYSLWDGGGDAGPSFTVETRATNEAGDGREVITHTESSTHAITRLMVFRS